MSKEKVYRLIPNGATCRIQFIGGEVEVPGEVGDFLKAAVAGKRCADAHVVMPVKGADYHVAYWGGRTGTIPAEVARQLQDHLLGMVDSDR